MLILIEEESRFEEAGMKLLERAQKGEEEAGHFAICTHFGIKCMQVSFLVSGNSFSFIHLNSLVEAKAEVEMDHVS